MLLRMKGGTPAFVDSLIKGIDIHSGSAIKKVEQQGEKVLVENSQGEQNLFDRVIVATPTSKIDEFLNPEQFAEDMNLLKQFRFEQGDLVIHTDATSHAPRRKDWSVLSYFGPWFTRQQFTVWMNAVEPTLVGKILYSRLGVQWLISTLKSYFKSIDFNACGCRLTNSCFKQRIAATPFRPKP